MTRCPYPHKIVKERITKPKFERFKLKNKQKEPKMNEKWNAPNIPANDEKNMVKRYFADESKKKNNQNSEMSSSSDSANQNTSIEHIEKIIVVRKPIIGSLPSFIPIG